MGTLARSARWLWKGIGLHEDLGRTLMFEMRFLVDPILSRMSPSQRRRMRELRRGRGLRLNLGCGPRRLDGWVNVDGMRNENADVIHDLRRRLPMARESAAVIVAEHVLEHFFTDEAKRFLRECWRVLEPGGVLRVVVPDAERLMRAYVDGDNVLLRAAVPGEWSAVGAINHAFRQNLAHRFMYDFDELRTALEGAGFATVERVGPGISSIAWNQYELRTEQREAESLYVEARKS